MLRRLTLHGLDTRRRWLRTALAALAASLCLVTFGLAIQSRTASAPAQPPIVLRPTPAAAAGWLESEPTPPLLAPSPTPMLTPSPMPLTPIPTHRVPSMARLMALPPPAQEMSRAIDRVIEQAIEEGQFPGAVVLVASHGRIVKLSAYGYGYLYADAETRLAQPVRMTEDTVFDLASITKTFTSVAVMRLVEQGALDLDAPAARYLPEFAANGKQDVTIRQLLTHTSGLSAGFTGDRRRDTPEQRWQALYEQELQAPPGEKYIYSDLGPIALGRIVEIVSGTTLDRFLAREVIGPLGMWDTTYNPPSSWRTRIAATECQPPEKRGTLRGQVHDGNAWALGGVAGHAGLFSTASDLARFGQMMLNGGELDGVEILTPETVATMTRPQEPSGSGGYVGLIWELNEPWYMGEMASPTTFGHTGYTGTSIVVSPERKLVVVLLTNRLHPQDLHASLARVRSQVASMAVQLAEALK